MRYKSLILILVPFVVWACGETAEKIAQDTTVLKIDSTVNSSKDEIEGLKENAVTDTNFYVVDETELREVNLYKLNGEHVPDQTIDANSYLSIEFISEETYLAQKVKSKSLVIKDSVGVESNTSGLRLHLTHGTKIYKNSYEPAISDYDSAFYCNQSIPELNCYVVSGHYWEAHDYRLVDKSKGIELAVLNDYPLLSPDVKRLATIWADPYGGGTYLEVYSYQNHALQHNFEVQFPSWMSSYGKDDAFWIDANTLYVKITPASDYKKPDDAQYAKITLK